MAPVPSPCPICGMKMVATKNRGINVQTFECQCGHLETYTGASGPMNVRAAGWLKRATLDG
jgi:hypothetical protein